MQLNGIYWFIQASWSRYSSVKDNPSRLQQNGQTELHVYFIVKYTCKLKICASYAMWDKFQHWCDPLS